MLSVRLSILFTNLAKQNKENIVRYIVGLAEWIIDDTSSFLCFLFLRHFHIKRSFCCKEEEFFYCMTWIKVQVHWPYLCPEGLMLIREP